MVHRAIAAMAPVEVRIGGAIGVDTLALRAARADLLYFVGRIVVYVPFTLKDQPVEAQIAIRECADKVVELDYPQKKWAYLRRNEKMLVGAHLCLAFTDGRQSGGTAHTMRVARNALIPVKATIVRSSKDRR
jgi:hypothetical protein